jgi:hypothetical protein
VATLDAIRAEAAVLKDSFASLRPQNQMLVDYERLRLDSLEFKAQLAVAKVESYTADKARGRVIADALDTGCVHIGDQTIYDDQVAPFGGTGQSGNGGRFGGDANLDEFTQWRWITERDEPASYPF